MYRQIYNIQLLWRCDHGVIPIRAVVYDFNHSCENVIHNIKSEEDSHAKVITSYAVAKAQKDTFNNATVAATSKETNTIGKVGAIRDGNLWIVVIVKSCVNKQAGSWLATQE